MQTSWKCATGVHLRCCPSEGMVTIIIFKKKQEDLRMGTMLVVDVGVHTVVGNAGVVDVWDHVSLVGKSVGT